MSKKSHNDRSDYQHEHYVKRMLEEVFQESAHLTLEEIEAARIKSLMSGDLPIPREKVRAQLEEIAKFSDALIQGVVKFIFHNESENKNEVLRGTLSPALVRWFPGGTALTPKVYFIPFFAVDENRFRAIRIGSLVKVL